MKKLSIQSTPDKEQPLSKEQKRFNNYLKKIEATKLLIQETEEFDTWLRTEGAARILPVEQKHQMAVRSLVVDLHQTPYFKILNKSQSKKLHAIIAEQVSALLRTPLLADDVELQAIFDAHSFEEQSWNEQKAAEENEMKQDMLTMMERMFGLKMDMADLEDPEKFMKSVEDHDVFMKEMAEKEAERKANRKKTPKQIEAEAKRLAAEKAVKKSIKQMYTDLVRHFHPDKEQDEQLRAEKTEIMKQITSAYEADDHLKLLELQMTLMQRDHNLFSDFSETELRFFNNALKEQLNELEQKLEMADPKINGNMFGFLARGNNMTLTEFNIKMHIKRCVDGENQTLNVIKSIKDAYFLKNYIKEFELPDDLEDDMMLLAELFKSGGFKFK